MKRLIILFLLNISNLMAETRYWKPVFTDHFYSKNKAVSLGHSQSECFDNNQRPLICSDLIGVDRPCYEVDDYILNFDFNLDAHEHLNRCNWRIYSHFNYMVGDSTPEMTRQNTFRPHHVEVDPRKTDEGEGFLILSAEYEADNGDFSKCGFKETSDLYMERDWDRGTDHWKFRVFNTESCPIVSGAIDAREEVNRPFYLRDKNEDAFSDFIHPGHQQIYGRFEARIKMPKGEGAWPAFWMVPQFMWRKHSEEMPIPYAPEDEYCSWPDTGEIDIVELWDRNNINKVYGTWHSGVCDRRLKMKSEGTIKIPDTSNFNLYAVEWDERSLRFYINNIQYYDITCTRSGSGWKCPKFPAKNRETKKVEGDFETYIPHDPFFIILNLSIYNVKDPSQFKRMEMVIDYVKTYEQCAGAETSSDCFPRNYNTDTGTQFEKNQELATDNHRMYLETNQSLVVQTSFITTVPEAIDYLLLDGTTGQILKRFKRPVTVEAGVPHIDKLNVALIPSRFYVLHKTYSKEGLAGKHSHKFFGK